MESGTRLALSNQTLAHRFYYQLRLIRELERRLPLFSGNGTANHGSALARGDICEEVGDVGVLNAIDVARDSVFSARREHVHFLIHNDDVAQYAMRCIERLRSEGCKGSAPLAVDQLSTEQEKSVGNAMSAALDSMREGAGAISVVFLDGAVTGAEEARRRQIIHYFSIASLWSLPILYVLTTSVALRSDGPDFLEAGALPPKGLNGEELVSRSIMADDVLKVYAFASAASAYVRSNCRPFLLQLTSCRKATERTPLGAISTGDEALWKMARKIDLIDRVRLENFIARRVESALETVRATSATRHQV